MIAMRVADENMADRPFTDGAYDSVKMRRVFRTGINDGDSILADDIGVGAEERERPRIVDRQPLHTRGNFDCLAVSGIESGVEIEAHRNLCYRSRT